jgi:hypothetical protein
MDTLVNDNGRFGEADLYTLLTSHQYNLRSAIIDAFREDKAELKRLMLEIMDEIADDELHKMLQD